MKKIISSVKSSQSRLAKTLTTELYKNNSIQTWNKDVPEVLTDITEEDTDASVYSNTTSPEMSSQNSVLDSKIKLCDTGAVEKNLNNLSSKSENSSGSNSVFNIIAKCMEELPGNESDASYGKVVIEGVSQTSQQGMVGRN